MPKIPLVPFFVCLLFFFFKAVLNFAKNNTHKINTRLQKSEPLVKPKVYHEVKPKQSGVFTSVNPNMS